MKTSLEINARKGIYVKEVDASSICIMMWKLEFEELLIREHQVAELHHLTVIRLESESNGNRPQCFRLRYLESGISRWFITALFVTEEGTLPLDQPCQTCGPHSHKVRPLNF
jgi:hypothetical protein